MLNMKAIETMPKIEKLYGKGISDLRQELPKLLEGLNESHITEFIKEVGKRRAANSRAGNMAPSPAWSNISAVLKEIRKGVRGK